MDLPKTGRLFCRCCRDQAWKVDPPSQLPLSQFWLDALEAPLPSMEGAALGALGPLGPLIWCLATPETTRRNLPERRRADILLKAWEEKPTTARLGQHETR